MIRSKALEANIANYHIDVEIDPRYTVLQEVMSRYYGIMEAVNTFLKELSHPYKNWRFIVQEARTYALDYFHLMLLHPEGHRAADRFVEIFGRALDAERADRAVQTDAADSLLMFLHKIICDSREGFARFAQVIEAAFERMSAADDDTFMVFVKNHHQLNRLAEALLKAAPAGTDMTACNRVLIRYFHRTYAYWAGQPDPWRWFCGQVQDVVQCPALEEIFDGVSLDEIHRWRQDLGAVTEGADPSRSEMTRRLLGLTGYSQIVDRYRGIPRRLLAAGQKSGQGQRWKIIFLFHIMNIPGLSMIHEEILRAINRTLSWLIANEPDYRVKRLIRQTFAILKTRTLEFPATALNCVLNMGRGVYQTDDSELVNFFIDAVIDLGFQAPMIGGVGDDWQVKVNNAHILNIRTWLALIERNPKWSPRLISYLIIHLSLCGVFIKDTDLFQRDITGLLNSGIAPVFNLVKQLARLFPVYFNDIGAEGRLRDISTQVDELVHRRDPLVHFLRKQSHVESSSRVLDLMEATIQFWETGEKQRIEPFVPPNLYAQIDVNGPWVDGPRRILRHLRHSGLELPRGLLEGAENHIASLIEAAADTDPVDRERMRLMVSFYRMLYQKYHTVFSEIESHLAVLRAEAFPDVDKLAAVLQETHPKLKLMGLLAYSEQLKELLLSDQTYEVREDIYKKRHFTVDIPSMYGSYHELKFDALGLTFRIESLANALLDRLVEELDLSLITKATFFQIYERLKLFDWALKIDGLRSVELERQLHLLAHSLEVKGFTFTQYLDIFKGFAQAVKNIINDYFNNIHEANLNRILGQIPASQLLPKYLPSDGTEDPERLRHRVSEIFFRDQMAMSLGLQQLDRFLGRILNTLFHQAEKLPDSQLHLLLNYDPQRVMTSIDYPSARMTGIILLGTKGYNMVQLKGFGLPVPPGFIITTEAFRCRSLIEEYPRAEENFKEQLARHLKGVERITGLHFGAPDKPLLFSVRSGSAISQPGMMDTFLDVGINEEIAAGMAAHSGNPWFAWDCYRRFLQCFGMAFGLERDAFDAVISEFKRRLSIPYKRDFSGDHMRKVALTYKNLVQDHGVEIPAAPFDQLLVAIRAVFASWHSPKAQTYRKIMGISDDWGTAVTVQKMVFGNRRATSGTGVFFTHSPRWSGDILKLWGDFTVGNQGEDVVSGLVTTLPISLFQQEREMRDTDITLETHYPQIYNQLKEWANTLIYQHGWSPQEMEFTFESPEIKDLYLLQSRDMAIRERKKVYTFDPEGIDPESQLGHGIGVAGGAMAGRLVFSLEEIDHWRAAEPGTHLILVRGDTVPDDIREINAADGLLTARGGVTSHAAVVAHRLEKTCVVGCANLVCDEVGRRCRFGRVKLGSGDFISIDGQAGAVYQGRIQAHAA